MDLLLGTSTDVGGMVFPAPAELLHLLELTNDDNDLVLPEVTVSAHHALLTRNNSGWHIQDLGSTNGTQLAQRRNGFIIPIEKNTRSMYIGI